MKTYADTSFALSLYREQTSSQSASGIMRRITEPLPLTPLVLLELRNGLNLAVFRKELAITDRDAAWSFIQQDIRAGVWAHCSPSMDDIHATAIELTDRHGVILGVRTLDILHVATALTLRVKLFLTFDHRQQRLADAAGLLTDF